MPDTTDVPLRYLQLRDDHQSLDNGGNLEPLREVGVSVPVQVTTALGEMTEQIVASVKPADELTDDLHARIIPNTRMIETRLGRLCDLLLDGGRGQFVEIDPPTKKAIQAAEKETDKHLEYHREYAALVEKGEAPAPDADDPGATPAPVAATQAELQARGRPAEDPPPDESGTDNTTTEA